MQTYNNKTKVQTENKCGNFFQYIPKSLDFTFYSFFPFTFLFENFSFFPPSLAALYFLCRRKFPGVILGKWNKPISWINVKGDKTLSTQELKSTKLHEKKKYFFYFSHYRGEEK